MQDSSKKSLMAVITILFIALSVSTGVFLLQDNKESNNDSKNQIETQEEVLSETTSKLIDIKINNGNEEKTYSANFEEGENVFDLLEGLQEENEDFTFGYEEYEFGAMIKSINNQEPDDSHFWKLQINGEDAQVGVSDYIVQQDDQISFVLDEIQM